MQRPMLRLQGSRPTASQDPIRVAQAALVLLVLAASSIGCAALQAQAAFATSSEEEERFVRRLAEAASEGDREGLSEVLRTYMAPGAIEGDQLDSFAEGWLFDVRRYGRLSYASSEMDGGELMHWLRADPSQAWLGIKVYDGEGGYRGFAIRRGSAPAEPAAQVPEDLSAHLANYMRRLADADMFSGSVLVADSDSIVLANGYGALYPGGPRITPDTPLNIASVGKMFTAVAVLQLVQNGQVALDDSLGKWVPEYPAAIGSAVTVRDLLLHTSGIELDEIPEFNARVLRAESITDLLEIQLAFAGSLLEQDGSYERSGEFDYTNEGINLLGVVIERASAVPYCRYLERHVFEPASMENTHCEFGTHFILGYGYDPSDRLGPRIPNREDLGAIPWPAGMHLSSARDLYRFHRAFTGGVLLDDRLARDATTVQIVEAQTQTITYAYGYGFEIQNYLGLTSVGHAGGMEGVSARYAFYPEHDRLVVVLSNYDTAGVIVASYLRDLTAAR